MKKTFITLFFTAFFIIPAASQSFDEAMVLYASEEFANAAGIFSELGDDQSALFAGKSYLALTDYENANDYLYRASESPQAGIRYEALYSLALSHYGLKNFDKSLDYLYAVIQGNHPGLRSDSRRFYSQILHFLSPIQRFEILPKLETSSVRYDVVRISRSYMQPEQYQNLVSELLELTPEASTRNRLRDELLDNQAQLPIPFQYPAAPAGTIYNIGVVLPTFDQGDPDFTIPRNLYFGMVLAADEFNSQNPDKKVNLIFRNSAEHPDTTEAALNELFESKRIDAVIGPLFSEPATRMAALSEQLQLPMIAPLANSAELYRNNSTTFQLNPTLVTHGREMARFAVRELGLTNLGVIIDQGSPHRPVAMEFRREAERLGARITHFIEQNFEAIGYDFSDATQVFERQVQPGSDDEILSVNVTQAIYAPFTGQASSTMMNLLMNELESMRSNLVILGTEDWEQHSLSNFQENFFEVYYSQAFFENKSTPDSELFEQEYQVRFGSAPDRFSRVGFDTAAFLFKQLEKAGNPEYLPNALLSSDPYQGLAYRIHFEGERINQRLYMQPLSQKAKDRLEALRQIEIPGSEIEDEDLFEE